MSQILIVEDEPRIAAFIAKGLKAAGYTPVVEASGLLAVARAVAGEPDLIVLDVGLPDIDGYALLRELRRGRDLPAIFLTARQAEAERVLGLELGADDYIAKPFSPRELVARVRAVLRRGRAPQTSSGFEHDAEGHRVFFRGRLLDLTRYEYGVMAALLQRPGAILTRAQLMDRVWGDGSDSTDRTVDTHIKTLRAKLREIDAEADPIRTQRGLGYSLQVG